MSEPGVQRCRILVHPDVQFALTSSVVSQRPCAALRCRYASRSRCRALVWLHSCEGGGLRGELQFGESSFIPPMLLHSGDHVKASI